MQLASYSNDINEISSSKRKTVETYTKLKMEAETVGLYINTQDKDTGRIKNKNA